MFGEKQTGWGVGGKTDEGKGRQNRELRGDGGGGESIF